MNQKIMRQILIPLLLASAKLQAQDLSPALLAPAGNAETSPGGETLSWSIGEIAIQHSQNSEGWLTEGFQQPDSARTLEIDTTAQRTSSKVITPNDDDKNAVFDPVFALDPLGVSIFEAELQIFNRWGERVFYEKSPAPKWFGKSDGSAGKPMPQATYYYVLKFRGSGDWREEKGTITVLN